MALSVACHNYFEGTYAGTGNYRYQRVPHIYHCGISVVVPLLDSLPLFDNVKQVSHHLSVQASRRMLYGGIGSNLHFQNHLVI